MEACSISMEFYGVCNIIIFYQLGGTNIQRIERERKKRYNQSHCRTVGIDKA